MVIADIHRWLPARGCHSEWSRRKGQLCDDWIAPCSRRIKPRWPALEQSSSSLLGLELLVGTDIISTITPPLSFESVGLLAAIVAIRTFLSFSPETEIEGCWPWQRAARDAETRTGIGPDR